jgi:XTP/dITP diphosphohydrolase
LQKSENREEEFGDLMFSLINYARFVDINPENALSKTNLKFMKRFQLMESLIQIDGLIINELNLEQMDVYWERAKLILKNEKTD